MSITDTTAGISMYLEYISNSFKDFAEYSELIEISKNKGVINLREKIDEFSLFLNDYIEKNQKEHLTYKDYLKYINGEISEEEFNDKLSKLKSELRNKKINDLVDE